MIKLLKYHATIMAVVGWYFMVPPIDKPTAPMSQWTVQDRYDTEADCQNYQQILGNHINNVMQQEGHAKPDTAQTMLLLGQCVEGDDPRLKQ